MYQQSVNNKNIKLHPSGINHILICALYESASDICSIISKAAYLKTIEPFR